MTWQPYRIRIVVVDDHPAVRHRLCDLSECYPDLQVIGAAEDGPGVLDAAKILSPDVILLDVGLPGLSGLDVARKLGQAPRYMRIIMLTSFDVDYVAKTLQNKAHGFLAKKDTAEYLVKAIRAVYRGERWMPPPGLHD